MASYQKRINHHPLLNPAVLFSVQECTMEHQEMSCTTKGEDRNTTNRLGETIDSHTNTNNNHQQQAPPRLSSPNSNCPPQLHHHSHSHSHSQKHQSSISTSNPKQTQKDQPNQPNLATQQDGPSSFSLAADKATSKHYKSNPTKLEISGAQHADKEIYDNSQQMIGNKGVPGKEEISNVKGKTNGRKRHHHYHNQVLQLGGGEGVQANQLRRFLSPQANPRQMMANGQNQNQINNLQYDKLQEVLGNHSDPKRYEKGRNKTIENEDSPYNQKGSGKNTKEKKSKEVCEAFFTARLKNSLKPLGKALQSNKNGQLDTNSTKNNEEDVIQNQENPFIRQMQQNDQSQNLKVNEPQNTAHLEVEESFSSETGQNDEETDPETAKWAPQQQTQHHQGQGGAILPPNNQNNLPHHTTSQQEIQPAVKDNQQPDRHQYQIGSSNNQKTNQQTLSSQEAEEEQADAYLLQSSQLQFFRQQGKQGQIEASISEQLATKQALLEQKEEKKAVLAQSEKDEQMIDLNNYKGIYFEDDNEKYSCPVTGAHFRFEDLCNRMERIRKKRGDPLVKFDKNGDPYLVNQSSASTLNKDINSSSLTQNRRTSTTVKKNARKQQDPNPNLLVSSDQILTQKTAKKQLPPHQAQVQEQIHNQTSSNNKLPLQQTLSNQEMSNNAGVQRSGQIKKNGQFMMHHRQNQNHSHAKQQNNQIGSRTLLKNQAALITQHHKQQVNNQSEITGATSGGTNQLNPEQKQEAAAIGAMLAQMSQSTAVPQQTIDGSLPDYSPHKEEGSLKRKSQSRGGLQDALQSKKVRQQTDGSSISQSGVTSLVQKFAVLNSKESRNKSHNFQQQIGHQKSENYHNRSRGGVGVGVGVDNKMPQVAMGSSMLNKNSGRNHSNNGLNLLGQGISSDEIQKSQTQTSLLSKQQKIQNTQFVRSKKASTAQAKDLLVQTAINQQRANNLNSTRGAQVQSQTGIASKKQLTSTNSHPASQSQQKTHHNPSSQGASAITSQSHKVLHEAQAKQEQLRQQQIKLSAHIEAIQTATTQQIPSSNQQRWPQTERQTAGGRRMVNSVSARNFHPQDRQTSDATKAATLLTTGTGSGGDRGTSGIIPTAASDKKNSQRMMMSATLTLEDGKLFTNKANNRFDMHATSTSTSNKLHSLSKLSETGKKKTRKQVGGSIQDTLTLMKNLKKTRSAKALHLSSLAKQLNQFSGPDNDPNSAAKNNQGATILGASPTTVVNMQSGNANQILAQNAITQHKGAPSANQARLQNQSVTNSQTQQLMFLKKKGAGQIQAGGGFSGKFLAGVQDQNMNNLAGHQKSASDFNNENLRKLIKSTSQATALNQHQTTASSSGLLQQKAQKQKGEFNIQVGKSQTQGKPNHVVANNGTADGISLAGVIHPNKNLKRNTTTASHTKNFSAMSQQEPTASKSSLPADKNRYLANANLQQQKKRQMNQTLTSFKKLQMLSTADGTNNPLIHSKRAVGVGEHDIKARSASKVSLLVGLEQKANGVNNPNSFPIKLPTAKSVRKQQYIKNQRLTQGMSAHGPLPPTTTTQSLSNQHPTQVATSNSTKITVLKTTQEQVDAMENQKTAIGPASGMAGDNKSKSGTVEEQLISSHLAAQQKQQTPLTLPMKSRNQRQNNAISTKNLSLSSTQQTLLKKSGINLTSLNHRSMASLTSLPASSSQLEQQVHYQHNPNTQSMTNKSNQNHRNGASRHQNVQKAQMKQQLISRPILQTNVNNVAANKIKTTQFNHQF